MMVQQQLVALISKGAQPKKEVKLDPNYWIIKLY